MDLIAIAQSVWRYKLATIPVILLTLVGVVYMGVLKPATYEADASYILMAPPAPPTTLQIAKDPALGRINTNNAYLRFGDLSIVVALLSQSMTSNTNRQALVNEGADPRYIIAPSNAFGGVAPIIQISGIGSTAYSAIRSAQLVSKATVNTLHKLQSAQGTNPAYMITTLAVSAPTQAQIQISSKLRTVISVLALGAMLLFVVVSTMSGLEDRRTRRKLRATGDAAEELSFALPQHQPQVRAEPTVPAEPPRLPARPGTVAMPDSGIPHDLTRSNGSPSPTPTRRTVRAFAWRR
jgi:hypothetical protein